MQTHPWLFGLLTAILWSLGSNTHATTECEPWAARLTFMQGQVEVRRTGQMRWEPVQLQDSFCPGDSLRVEARSEAGILLYKGAPLRLEQRTTITFAATEDPEPSWIDLIRGAVYFIGRVPRTLQIRTAFVNAAVEGTEFMVRIETGQTALWVFEGRVLAVNEAGSLILTSGQAAIAQAGTAPRQRLIVRPRDAVQWALYYPPIIDYHHLPPGTDPLRQALAPYRQGDLAGTFARLDAIPVNQRDALYFNLRAALLLSVGSLAAARADIQQALDLDPHNGTAIALQAIMAVVQNDQDQALDLARQAARLDPQSPIPQVALSYVYQAEFALEKALAAAQQAIDLDPANALAWARLAELWLSLGELDRALKAAQEAVVHNPELARTQTVLGFAYLTQMRIDQAKAVFTKAIGLEQTAPLPRLGLGLAKIRESALAEGVQEIEIAASLDPNNALIRSYLGKAYFEERRADLAGNQFAIAKKLDPQDPTPWFYDAIREQTENRPVSALSDLQQSIELNDNRAVYRSRLLLDEDLAMRGSSLARSYDDLGFEQLAQVEAAHSLTLDPANHSAHRFLADSYLRLPRREIARVSELLQAQLLQPINITPVQPRLTETNLNILAGAGPAEAAFNEFTPLFVRNQVQLTASGLVGNNATLGGEAVVSGIFNRFSYSLGQFHYETDGFRENNDVKHDIYNVFTQAALTDKINIQFEYRRRETDQGDLRLNFAPDIRTERRRSEHDTARLGLRLAPSPRTDLIASLIYSDRTAAAESLFPGFSVTESTHTQGYDAQAQYLFREDWFNITVGAGIYEIDVDSLITIEQAGVASILPSSDSTIKQDNLYAYSNITYPEQMIWTLGLGYDAFDDGILDLEELNPKLGLQWNITDRLRLRAAALETLKRFLIVDQTLEPTQVAGFNQFFDDVNGTTAALYAAGLDATLTSTLYGGMEASRRDLEVPTRLGTEIVFNDRKEDLYRAYLYWVPYPDWAFSAEYQFENIRTTFSPLVGQLPERFPTKLKMHSVPLAARYFSPQGAFAELEATFVRQEIDLTSSTPPFNQTSEEFVIVDAALGYRLPNRRGILSFKVRNLFDKEFLFQDLSFISADPIATTPRFIPDRTVLARFTLAF